MALATRGRGDDLEAFLVEHPACRLVVVDVFAKVRGRVGESNVYEADYAAMSRLKVIADKHRVCGVVVHSWSDPDRWFATSTA